MNQADSTTFVGSRPKVEDLPSRVNRLRVLALFGLFSGLAISAASLLTGLQAGAWPYTVISIAAGAIVLASIVCLVFSRGERINQAAWVLLAAMALGLPALAASISLTGVFLAVIGGLVLPEFFRPAMAPRHQRGSLYLSIVAGVTALLIDFANPTGRLSIPVAQQVLVGLNILLVLLAMIRLGQHFGEYTLRTKLLLSFLGVSIIPLALLAYLSDQSIRSALRQEANNKLFSAAAQTAETLDTFMSTRKAEIETQGQFAAYRDFLLTPPSERSGSPAQAQAFDLLTAPTRLQMADIESLALLDAEGENVLDTFEANIGQDESNLPYFEQAVQSGLPYASTILVGDFSQGEPSIFFSNVIRSAEGAALGVLRARYSVDTIQSIIASSEGLAGEDSFAVVFSKTGLIHLAHSNAPETIMQAVGPLTPSEAQRLINDHLLPDLPAEELSTNLPDLEQKLNQIDQSSFFEAEDVATGERINQVAVAEMGEQPWLVSFFQPQDVLFAPAETQARNTLGLSVFIAALVAVLALVISQLVAQPINQLTEIATKIAEGDLEAEVPITTTDEIGLLARAFNSMTFRLRSLIAGLEDRVAERTQDLARRADQLQVASEVAKDASEVRDVNRLLNDTVRQISERFGYYHAGVFLVDEDEEFAVLQAASSTGGQRMLEREHKLAVGKVGLVGYVTGTGKPRIALDVGEDAVHFANPDLPDTRSEIALPLMTGNQIIGALDVQSIEEDAFDEEDVVALQTMADQLAIAIENTRLLARQTELAQDRRKAIDVYRQLTGSLGYDQILADTTRLVRATFGFDRVTLGLVEGNEVTIRSASAATQARLPRLGRSVPVGQGLLGRTVSTQAPVRLDSSTPADTSRSDPALGELETSLGVPLISRGKAIGVLVVERADNRIFTGEDIELLELLASQAAVSIENARLFEETQTRLRQVDALYRRQTAESWELLVNARRVQGEENLAAFGDESVDPDLVEGEPIETPISLRGEIIGKLDILPKQMEDWSDEDFEILQGIAEEVAGQLEQLRLVEEIQRRATQLETAAEIARVATGLLDLDPLLKRAVDLLQQRFGFYHVAIYLVEPGSNSAFIREASGEIGEALKQTRRRFEVGSRTVIGFATGSGEFYVAHDTETDPYFKESNLLPDSQSELAVPLKIGDRVIGALDVHDEGRYAFSEDDITILETLADQIAVAVENARLFQEALLRAEREQSVVQITSKIRASQGIDSILRTAVEEMRLAVGARRATIRLAPVPAEIRSNGGEAAKTNDSTSREERETPAGAGE